MKRKPVYLTPLQRRRAVEEFVRSLRKRGIEVLVVSIDRIHWHALVRCPDHNPFFAIPVHFRGSSHYLKREHLAPEGGLWGVRSECVPLEDRAHEVFAFDYIRKHARKGAAVWTFRQPLAR
jgi:hypothetical protein